MILISVTILIAIIIPLCYLLLLAIASIHEDPPLATVFRRPTTHFMIAIPAHNEANVIEATVKRLQLLNYPTHMYEIHIVADHCSDMTASLARQADAIVHERNEGARNGKGIALSWLFQRALEETYEAVVIFDADTRVDANFLRIMDARLSSGLLAIQGKHIISNPEKGWFPALTWAMFLIDNRFQNLGRANLGWSAKNMGDSICISADVLRKIGWGEGLTEDYQLRQRLLLEGIKIYYEPTAIGNGEAPLTWMQARAQRQRWLRGTRDASQMFARQLLSQGFKLHDGALLDGAFQAIFPSYSTLTIISLLMFVTYSSITFFGHVTDLMPISIAWLILLVILFIYPLFGLTLEHAPGKAYLVILSGPIYIIWRTALAFLSRFIGKDVVWIRTAHGDKT